MTKQLTKIDQVKNIMNSETVQEQFKNALRDNAKLFQASIIELLSNDTSLQECEPKSVITSALTLATLQLPLNKSLGFAYMVPYKKKGVKYCQPQIGYKGLIQLAQRTGLYKSINAGPVYEGELKSIDKLSGDVDLTGEKTSDKVIGYFAYFKTNYGFEKSIYWTREEIEKHGKRFSKSYKYDSSPWQTDFDSMAGKTVLKNLISHYGPMTIEIGDSISKAEEPDQSGFDIEIKPDNDFQKMAESMKSENQEEEPEVNKPKSLDEIMENGIDLSEED